MFNKLNIKGLETSAQFGEDRHAEVSITHKPNMKTLHIDYLGDGVFAYAVDSREISRDFASNLIEQEFVALRSDLPFIL